MPHLTREQRLTVLVLLAPILVACDEGASTEAPATRPTDPHSLAAQEALRAPIPETELRAALENETRQLVESACGDDCNDERRDSVRELASSARFIPGAEGILIYPSEHTPRWRACGIEGPSVVRSAGGSPVRTTADLPRVLATCADGEHVDAYPVENARMERAREECAGLPRANLSRCSAFLESIRRTPTDLGVRIFGVRPESPAHECGLRNGDRVVDPQGVAFGSLLYSACEGEGNLRVLRDDRQLDPR